MTLKEALRIINNCIIPRGPESPGSLQLAMRIAVQAMQYLQTDRLHYPALSSELLPDETNE